jgi:hypothetical protein
MSIACLSVVVLNLAALHASRRNHEPGEISKHRSHVFSVPPASFRRLKRFRDSKAVESRRTRIQPVQDKENGADSKDFSYLTIGSLEFILYDRERPKLRHGKYIGKRTSGPASFRDSLHSSFTTTIRPGDNCKLSRRVNVEYCDRSLNLMFEGSETLPNAKHNGDFVLQSIASI